MTFAVSPGVYNVEKNYNVQVPNLATTIGAIAGIFAWGPLFQPTAVGSQANLIKLFGQPQNWNYETWFSAFNFLEYGKNLYVVRTANTTANATFYANCALNAVASGANNASNNDVWNSVITNFASWQRQANTGGWPSTVQYVAKWPSGLLGNSLAIGQCDSANQYHTNVAISGTISGGAASGNSYVGTFVLTPGSNVGVLTVNATSGSNIAAGNTWANTLITSFSVGDYFKVNTNIRSTPFQYLQTTAFSNAVTNSTLTTLNINFSKPYSGGSTQSSNVAIERYWEYYRQITPPASWVSPYQMHSTNPAVADLMQVIIIDQNGQVSGVPNTVLEIFSNVSRATDAQTPSGTTNYYQNVINQNSQWVWAVNDRSGAPSANSGSLVAVTSGSVPMDVQFAGGQDGDGEAVAPLGTLINGWSCFQGVDSITIDLVIAGKPIASSAPAGTTGKTYYNFGLASWLISNIGEYRKDCVVFFSPDSANVLNNFGSEATDIVNWASLLPSSTYAFADTGYKSQYDQFNNVYRYIPLNGDIAGLCAYTDTVSYPWMSPAGFNRGQIANVTQLAYNPQEPDRDILYPNAINPVVTFPGQGTYLYGGKTFTTAPTGFSRLNVRRLFLMVERAVKYATRWTLFELNDAFTQNQFKNMVTPYLGNIQGQGGIVNFLVDCDGTVNTPVVQNGNQFLASVFIQPTPEIDFVQITYVNTPLGVAFSTLENVSVG